MSAWRASAPLLTLALATGCASTLEWTVAIGPTAKAELKADPEPGARETLHTDNTFPLADTTREGPATPPTKSVSKGSNAPKAGIFGPILAWLAGWLP